MTGFVKPNSLFRRFLSKVVLRYLSELEVSFVQLNDSLVCAFGLLKRK